MKRISILLATGLLCAGSAWAQDGLTVSVSQRAPMTVQITGPVELVSLATKGFDGIPIGGCMYSIDWGDGSVQPVGISEGPPYCTSDLSHTYAAAGEYVITVETYDIGPADGPENEREGKITVNVQ